MARTAALPFDELAAVVAERCRSSVYGHISGQQLDRAAPGEASTSLPFRPVFIGDTERGVLHGGVITAMLDESCGMAVELALDGTRAPQGGGQGRVFRTHLGSRGTGLSGLNEGQMVEYEEVSTGVKHRHSI